MCRVFSCVVGRGCFTPILSGLKQCKIIYYLLGFSFRQGIRGYSLSLFHDVWGFSWKTLSVKASVILRLCLLTCVACSCWLGACLWLSAKTATLISSYWLGFLTTQHCVSRARGEREREQEQEHVREGARQKLLPFVTQLQKSYSITFLLVYLEAQAHVDSRERDRDPTSWWRRELRLHWKDQVVGHMIVAVFGKYNAIVWDKVFIWRMVGRDWPYWMK